MIKNIILFLGGVVFMFVVFVAVGRYAEANNQVLGASTVNFQSVEVQVKDRIQKGEKEGLILVKDGLFPRIITAIANNPILAPFIKTQKEVTEAVRTVKDLPGDQRDAICNQICP